MTGPLTIAVDGPAASGKSTLARHLARHFRLPFLDTGLLYRAVGRRLLEADAAPGDELAAVAAAQALAPREVEGARLRGEGIGQRASQVAAMPAVRAALLPFQRDFARQPAGAVLAGRDIGTIVCPDALFKLFVTASEAERARRRYEELRARGEQPIYAAVLDELRERDRRDAERAVAPLRAAPDAWLLDTSTVDAEAAFAAARRHIEDCLRAAPASSGRVRNPSPGPQPPGSGQE